MRIACGKEKSAAGDPKVWFTSTEFFAKALPAGNRELLRVIAEQIPGRYRRDHLRAFAQRVEVAEREVSIKGSKEELLRTLVAIGGGKSACPVPYRDGGAKGTKIEPSPVATY